MAVSPRERLVAEPDSLSDEQIEAVLRYVEILKSDDLAPGYDPQRDPVVGFVSGPTDFGERAEELLSAG